MELKKLRDFADGIDDARYTSAPDAMQARAALYGAMADYVRSALTLSVQGRQEDTQDFVDATGAFVEALCVDAFRHLEHPRYVALMDYDVTDTIGATTDHKALYDSIVRMWGDEDLFILRINGPFTGSYIKGLTGLKAQARYAGTTLPRLLTTYRKAHPWH